MQLRATMKVLVLVAMMVCLLESAHAHDAEERDTESKLMALERVVRVQALSSKDLSGLNGFLSDEFVLVTMDGAQKDKAELLAYLQSLNFLRYAIEEMIVRVHGDTAIVTGLFRMTTVQKGRPSVRTGRFLDTWLNRDGHWSMVASVSIPAS
jgi:ketosteroid isomerase-like protein